MPVIIRHRQSTPTPTPTTPNPRMLIFKCSNGLGNRLNNLMNMFYLHAQYPSATIYLIWNVNNHCGAPITDLFDLSGFHWINQGRPPPYRDAFYATTSSIAPSPWDAIEHWRSRPVIESHAYIPFRFVTPQFMIDTFHSLQLTPAIQNQIRHLCSTRGINRPIVHYRQGDLLRLLDSSGGDIAARLAAIPSEWQIHTYTQDVPDRPCDAVLNAMAELLYFARHCDLRGYSPYSTFSSWIFLLSPRFTADKPIMKTAIVDVIFL